MIILSVVSDIVGIAGVIVAVVLISLGVLAGSLAISGEGALSCDLEDSSAVAQLKTLRPVFLALFRGRHFSFWIFLVYPTSINA